MVEGKRALRAEARVGTSGWSYPEWVGRFYPSGTSPARMLPFYARRFRAVELHSTFRSLPSPAAVARWIESVPADFRFAPKAHIGITHRRDLDGLAERVKAFLDAIAPLGHNLGPVLVALPHQAVDLERLDRLLSTLPAAGSDGADSHAARFRFAFQLHAGWLVPQVLDRLHAHGSSLVVVDSNGPPPRLLRVGSFSYIRLRRDRYMNGDLARWADQMAEELADERDAYLFVKHDEVGDGPRYARQVSRNLGISLVTSADDAAITALLGRPPQGRFDVCVRDRRGNPVVIRNAPLLADGTPMPTRYWLVDERLCKEVSRLEAAGGVKEAAAAVDPAELEQTHLVYAAERDAELPSDYSGPRPSGGVGGTRRGVKCLHAHYAWYLAGGDDPVGRWVRERLPQS